MGRAGDVGLRMVLLLAGGLTVFAGLNKALGGMRTLGWQGEGAYLEVTNQHGFLVQDSHVRFLAGVYTGLGLIFLLAAANPGRLRCAVRVSCALILLGGLARLAQGHFEVTFGPDIVGSMIAELAVMPLIWLWVTKATTPHDMGRV